MHAALGVIHEPRLVSRLRHAQVCQKEPDMARKRGLKYSQKRPTKTRAALSLGSSLRARYQAEVAALQQEACAFFQTRNRVFDEVAVFTDKDLPTLRYTKRARHRP